MPINANIKSQKKPNITKNANIKTNLTKKANIPKKIPDRSLKKGSGLAGKPQKPARTFLEGAAAPNRRLQFRC